MLVCHCNGVSDKAIRKAVRKGASSASQVGMMTGAGTCCGGCVDSVKSIIRAESNRAERSSVETIVSLPVVPS